MSKFKPMLAPNETVNLDEVNYPILVSYKLDGIRCIFKDGELLTRSLKQLQNKQLREKLQPLADYSKEHNVILDGEIYSPKLTFQEITRFVMTQDFEDAKSVKKHGEVLKIPEHLKFYAFDCVNQDNLTEEFIDRIDTLQDIANTDEFEGIFVHLDQDKLESKQEVETYFEHALGEGYEGLILKSFEGKYKCGRGTIKEGLIFKVKPFETFDAVILGIEQATKVDPKAERKINELGRSVTSKKKGDRICIEKASTFQVEYEGEFVFPVLAMTDIEKEEVWKNQEDYIGKVFEYKGMLVGAKDVPRHPVFVRFREDKDK